MIYTVTFNPSLDYIVSVRAFQPGRVNRTDKEFVYAGGKGINVSLVLKNLGFDNVAMGFVAGFTGDYLIRLMQEQGIRQDFIKVAGGFSRINVKIRSETESEINGKGPDITAEEVAALYRRLADLRDGDALVLAGSIPACLPDSMYMDIMRFLQNRKVRIVVDATRELLVNVLPYKPFLIKPNNHELGEIFGVQLKTREEVIPYARKLREMGAQNVLVSMAGEGAVLITETNEVYQHSAPKGAVVNSVGAGDSMVAGFLAGYLDTGDYGEALKKGICAGSASAFSETLATREAVEKIMNQLV